MGGPPARGTPDGHVLSLRRRYVERDTVLAVAHYPCGHCARCFAYVASFSSPPSFLRVSVVMTAFGGIKKMREGMVGETSSQVLTVLQDGKVPCGVVV